MASWYPIKELCEETTCPICHDYFKEPVMINCGHNFCQACLVQCCNQNSSAMVAPCPRCQEQYMLSTVLPNWQLGNIVEVVKKLQKGDGAEENLCEKLQVSLKFNCEDDQAPVSVSSCSEAGAQSMAVQYLKMDLPKLLEHCQQKGLRSEGLSVEDLRIRLIQHSSQPELESAKAKAKKIQQLEHNTQEVCDPKEMEPSQVLEKMGKEQTQRQKRKWEHLQLRKKQPDENILKYFTPFFPGEDPVTFLSSFETTARKQRVALKEYMVYLPPLLRGELAEFYHSLPDRGFLRYPVFKKALLNLCHGPGPFSPDFYTLQPQEERSSLEFVAKQKKVLKLRFGSVKAGKSRKGRDDTLNEYSYSLSDDIRCLEIKIPQDIFLADEREEDIVIIEKA